MAVDPILRFSNGTDLVDILAPNSGWKMASPYWNPQIAQYKSGGIKVNSALAEGQRLVHKEYDNVVETIPLVLNGTDQDRALKTLSDLLSLSLQSADYWAESYEFDDVWMQVQIACSSCYSGYARIVQMRIPELTNPFGQPFFSFFNEAVMEGISLIVEREPLWRAVPPGEVIGPLYNLIKNPDFELWNFGVTDSQPDNWTDLETIGITGTNSQEDTRVHSGQYALKVDVTTGNQLNRAKGVTQVISDIKNGTTYTVVAWVRSDSVQNGVGRILVTYSGQLEVYRVSSRHGWQLYTGTFTTGLSDTVAITLEILSTSTSTCRGTVYFDSLMLLEGDWEQEAIDGVLPYISGSHIVNHWDRADGIMEAGDINFLDVWNVPGNEDALVRLEIQNNTPSTAVASLPAPGSSPSEVYATIRAGMRRIGNIFDFQNYHDPVGISDTSCSGDNRLESSNLSTGWQTITSKAIAGGTINNEGRFRLLARIFDNKASGVSNLKLRISYFVGAAGINAKTLNSITANVVQTWQIVSLTPNAAINFDAKFETNPPSQLGYNIQASRESGNDKVYIDYAMLMPTDGGYLEANLDPPVNYGNALIVDNTGSQTVGTTQLRSGWRQVYRFSSPPTAIKEFNGNIHIIMAGSIIRYSNGTWAIIYAQSGLNTIAVMEEYNGRLYVGVNNSAGAQLWSSLDGIAFTNHGTFTGHTIVGGLKSYGSNLFITTSNNVSTNARIYRWDGSALTQEYSLTPGGTFVFGQMAIFGNQLYTTGGTNIYRRNNASATWTQIASAGEPLGAGLEPFGKKLLAGTQDSTIRPFNGTSFEAAISPPFGASVNGAVIFTTLGNRIYAAMNTGVANHDVVQSDDGVTWEVPYNSFVSSSNIGAIGTAAGVVVVGISASPTTIYTFSPSDFVAKVADFQGVPFTSPPQKRHRYIFSYDRKNFVNNIDDAALIGIGFVPRYLALRGRF